MKQRLNNNRIIEKTDETKSWFLGMTFLMYWKKKIIIPEFYAFQT